MRIITPIARTGQLSRYSFCSREWASFPLELKTDGRLLLTIAVRQPSSQLPRLRTCRNKDKMISRLGLRKLKIKPTESLRCRRRQTTPLIRKPKKQ